MTLGTDNGKLMGSAIKAVLDMQSDCVKMFRDLDKQLELSDLRQISGNTITTGLGSSITSPGLYLSQYLYRLYAPRGSLQSVLGINICFHDHNVKRYFIEPLFIAANISYEATQTDEALAVKSWDPWAAYLDWNQDRTFGTALDVNPGRSGISKIAVVAVPLYSITSIEVAVRTINLVGLPGHKSVDLVDMPG